MNDQLKQSIIDGDEGVALAMTQALIATGAGARAYGANAGMAVERAKELVG